MLEIDRTARRYRYPKAICALCASLAVSFACTRAAAPAPAAPITVTGIYHLVAAGPGLGIQTLRFLEVGRTFYKLRFAEPFDIEPEATVEITGQPVGTEIVVVAARQIAGPQARATTGTRKLLVIDVVWPGADIQTTQATATNFVFGTTDSQRRSVRQYYQDVSYAQLDWTGDVTPTLTIADPGRCDLYGIAGSADAAASAAGYKLGKYQNRMYDFPANYCGQDSAWGELGGRRTWISNGLWNIDWGYTRMGPDHELGHNLGLYHAHGLDCGSYTITLACLGGAQGRTCDNDGYPPPCYSEYGNSYDLMGNNWTSDNFDAVNWFGFAEEKQLGWFGGRFTSISDPHNPSTASYTLVPLEGTTPSPQQGLVINTDSRIYYLEFRAAISQDGFLSNWPDATNGVIVTMRNDIPGGDAGTLALDAAPNSDDSCTYCDFQDEVLNLGQNYSDVDGAFTLHVISVTQGASAVVEVSWHHTGPIVDHPSSVIVTTGTYRSGTAADLGADDESYFEVDSRGASTKKTAWYGRVPNVSRDLTSLKVSYDGQNSTSCTQILAIRNWTTSAYVTLDRRSVGPIDVKIPDLLPPGTPGDYVSGKGEVWLRAQCSTKSAAFTASGDLMEIAYTTP